MKEFQSTTGGRHAYNTDFKNLQELALAMQEIFRECGGNFVISGCKVKSGNNLSITDGYVYIGNRVCKVNAAANIQPTNLYIVARQRKGDTIPYANNTQNAQYIEYYAEVENTTSVNGDYIAFNPAVNAFPNLATVFFDYYSICKKAGNQSIGDLTIQNTLTVLKQLLAPHGVQFGNASMNITANGNDITITNGDFSLCFSDNGAISIKQGSNILLSFANGSGSGVVTFGSVTVQSDLRTKKLYIDGIDINDKMTPLGVVQMWAGKISSIPENYRLCDGQMLKIDEYSELYEVLGDTFNQASMPNNNSWVQPSSGMFRLPDLRQRFVVGYDSNNKDYRQISKTGGEEKHKLTLSEMPAHTHRVDDYYFIEANKTVAASNIYGQSKVVDGKFLCSNGSDTDNNTLLYTTHESASVGSSDQHENRPPFYVLAYIIRVK